MLTLEQAAREMFNYITYYDDALGHSYCNLNVGGGWAPEPVECTCGFDDMQERWLDAIKAAEAAAGTPPGGGLDRGRRAW